MKKIQITSGGIFFDSHCIVLMVTVYKVDIYVLPVILRVLPYLLQCSLW